MTAVRLRSSRKRQCLASEGPCGPADPEAEASDGGRTVLAEGARRTVA